MSRACPFGQAFFIDFYSQTAYTIHASNAESILRRPQGDSSKGVACFLFSGLFARGRGALRRIFYTAACEKKLQKSLLFLPFSDILNW